MKYLFLIKDNLWEGASTATTRAKVDAVCRASSLDATIVVSDTYGIEEEIARQFVRANPDEPLRVIACGNNETLHFALNAVVGVPRVELGLFPCDSDFDFFSSFPGVTNADITSLDALVNGRVMDMDVLRVNDRYCINVANIGVDVQVTVSRYKMISLLRRIPFLRLRKSTVVTLALARAFLLGMPDETAVVRINGYEVIDTPYMLMLFANTQRYGMGYQCAPRARSDDGLIEMLLIRKIALDMMPRAAGIVKRGEALTNEWISSYVEYRRCHHVNVQTSGPVPMSMDATVYLETTNFDITMMPAAMRILVPGRHKD